MNKFEQVSSNHHQMWLVRRRGGPHFWWGEGQEEWVPGLMSRGRDPYSEVQCIMGNHGHMGPTPLPMDGQTDAFENISIPQLHWRVVKMFWHRFAWHIFTYYQLTDFTDWLVRWTITRWTSCVVNNACYIAITQLSIKKKDNQSFFLHM